MDKYSDQEEGIRFQARENKSALLCGILAVALAVFISVMRMMHPAARGGGALLYIPLAGIILGGAAFFLLYFNRRICVDEMNICYVNMFRKKKQFTLDEIGYCQMGTQYSAHHLVVYDLTGKVLCKLDFETCDMAEFYQYLVDNSVRIERGSGRTRGESSFAAVLDAVGKEVSVCEEEIGRRSEQIYSEAVQILLEWENRNRQFEAEWEAGFAEYTAQDLNGRKRLWEYTSSIERPADTLPQSYECILEAYLKCGGEYVVSDRGREVAVMLPCFSKTRSYRIGEKTRIRQTDTEVLKEWLTMQLRALTKDLPRHRYHTESLVLRHPLTKTAGVQTGERTDA